MKSLFTLFIILITIAELDANDFRNLIPQPKLVYPYNTVSAISENISLCLQDTAESENREIYNYLQNQIRIKTKFNTSYLPFTPSNILKKGIVLLNYSVNKNIGSLKSRVLELDLNNKKGTYVIDIKDTSIVIAGADEEGCFNGASTFLQLLRNNGGINDLHIADYPTYPVRWNFSMHNLRGANAMTQMTKIADTMAYRKLNGWYHSDFKYNLISSQPDFYFDSVARFKQICNSRNIEIIPGVCGIGWSSGILWNDPNLAEGLLTKANYIAISDSAKLIPDANADIPNGGFENVNGNGKFIGWGFYDDNYMSQDKSIYYKGTASAKCTNFNGGNSRAMRTVKLQKNRGYLISCMVKADKFKCDEFRLMAIGVNQDNSSRVITFSAMSIPATTDWIRTEVVFNSLDFESINIYAGAWGASSGTFWMDDFKVQDIGLTNIIRREGTPLKVINKQSGFEYEEGIDFEKITDNIMLNSYGEFGPHHQPPKFKLTGSTRIKQGDTLTISSYHPFTAVSDNNGNGSVMVCVSNDSLYKVIDRQINDMKTLYSPSSYFMGHDEIRNMNHDDACLKTGKSPADLLGENITKCYNLIKQANPTAQTYMWSDMVDSLHNAHNNYYLINGDLTGIWNKIPKDITIVNWNGGNAVKSLEFFDKYGFKSISSPYYDSRDTKTIRDWRLAQETVNSVEGMMYTTWNNDFDFLTPFSYYAWGAGSNFIHKPILQEEIDQKSVLDLSAKVMNDPYDASAKTNKVELEVTIIAGSQKETNTIEFNRDNDTSYSISYIKPIVYDSLIYRLKALNTQGITSSTPYYCYLAGGTSVEQEQKFTENISLNNSEDKLTLISSLLMKQTELIDANGNLIELIQVNSNTCEINTLKLTSGFYILKVTNSAGIAFTKKINIIH